MKRGFTLIEMLVVIVIISLLSLMIFPTIMNQVGDKKSEISEVTKKMIIDAAELYARERNINNSFITLNDLVEDEKLEAPIKDSDTGKNIPLTLKIYIDKNFNACIDGQEKCEITEES